MSLDRVPSGRSFREKMGCAEAACRVLLLWGIFLGISFVLKRFFPALSLDVKPLNPIKVGVAMAALWAAFKGSGGLTRRLMDSMERRYGP